MLVSLDHDIILDSQPEEGTVLHQCPVFVDLPDISLKWNHCESENCRHVEREKVVDYLLGFRFGILVQPVVANERLIRIVVLGYTVGPAIENRIWQWVYSS